VLDFDFGNFAAKQQNDGFKTVLRFMEGLVELPEGFSIRAYPNGS
jgi:hypothetical protein